MKYDQISLDWQIGMAALVCQARNRRWQPVEMEAEWVSGSFAAAICRSPSAMHKIGGLWIEIVTAARASEIDSNVRDAYGPAVLETPSAESVR